MNGQNFDAILETFARYVNAPYVDLLRRLGLDREFVGAEGAEVFDKEGRSFVDCIAGYGNLNLGHNPRRVIAAVVEELQSPRPFNWPFVSTAHARLGERLAQIAPDDLECSLVVNSGAEAVDSALKLVRLVSGKPNVITMNGAWHGFTLGALSVSEPSLCRQFAPLLAGITHVAYGDIAAIEEAVTPEVGAVIIEPIQAEGGVIVPPIGYLKDLVDFCRRRGILLIFDEIKTGVGKTGRFFACEHENATPDILLLGKSLGGGVVPIGAVVASRKLWGSFGYSFAMSSSSGAGNAPACAAALSVINLLEEENLCDHADLMGKQLMRDLHLLTTDYPSVVSGASGLGLMAALHINNLKNANAIVACCIRKGVLVMNAFCKKTHILIEPPLCITNQQLSRVTKVLRESVAQLAT